MLEFSLSEGHKIFRDNYRKFCEKEIAPLVSEAEETETFPYQLFTKMARLGYICPRYPETSVPRARWAELAGKYDLVFRLPSGKVGSDVVGSTEIYIEDHVLKMAGWVGPILPISETEIIILSGSFAGETMLLEPETGNIYHQSIVFKPIEASK